MTIQMSTKTKDFKAGEQNIYAYQREHKWATLRYAIKNLFRDKTGLDQYRSKP